MRLLTLSLLCLSLFVYTGCTPESTESAASETEHSDENHPEHAETYAEAMEELGELQATIDKAFTADTPNDAHDALHEVGHVLDELKSLAKKEELEDGKLAEIEAGVEELFEAYGDLDGMMHGEGEADYAEIAKKIEESMAKLKI